jgi:hypothetical protein
MGVVEGLERGVGGFKSPVRTDIGCGCDVMLVRYVANSGRVKGDRSSELGESDAVRWLGEGVE